MPAFLQLRNPRACSAVTLSNGAGVEKNPLTIHSNVTRRGRIGGNAGEFAYRLSFSAIPLMPVLPLGANCLRLTSPGNSIVNPARRASSVTSGALRFNAVAVGGIVSADAPCRASSGSVSQSGSVSSIFRFASSR